MEIQSRFDGPPQGSSACAKDDANALMSINFAKRLNGMQDIVFVEQDDREVHA
ncbi:MULTISPECIES: hypothetical protein [unclassified Rhizobium]|jgi:hypothetical protein|uniref:hypothetical protein n=1 Tax=unclassified Rhizobium TaxID=2613769 RepID=UPI000A6DDA57|nr:MULTISPECIES: hypothetical protein [unclassified Rhizobium]